MDKKFHMCNAGVNAISVLPDGSANVCYDRKNENLGNIFTGFKFRDSLVSCDKVHCSCPLWAFEKELYKKAKGEAHENRPYQAYIHWHITYECQMLCEYCIVTGPDRNTDTKDKKKKTLPVDISAVKRTLDQTGKSYYISLMGGEPFMVPNIAEVFNSLTPDHIVGCNTNLAAVDPRFWSEVDIHRLGNFHISLHIGPMERKGLTEKFLENFSEMKRVGFTNFYVTTVAHPTVIKRIEKYRQYFSEKGVHFKLIPMIEGGGSTQGKVYPESYTKEELALIQTDWLNDYFPQKNAANKSVKINNFRPRNPGNSEHIMLEDED